MFGPCLDMWQPSSRHPAAQQVQHLQLVPHRAHGTQGGDGKMGRNSGFLGRTAVVYYPFKTTCGTGPVGQRIIFPESAVQLLFHDLFAQNTHHGEHHRSFPSGLHRSLNLHPKRPWVGWSAPRPERRGSGPRPPSLASLRVSGRTCADRAIGRKAEAENKGPQRRRQMDPKRALRGTKTCNMPYDSFALCHLGLSNPCRTASSEVQRGFVIDNLLVVLHGLPC